jgi:hypothetical protein
MTDEPSGARLHADLQARAMERARIEAKVNADLVRDILEALCIRDGISLESSFSPSDRARNYELALRLRIGHVFGLPSSEEGPRPVDDGTR